MTALNSTLSLRGHFEEAWRAHTRQGMHSLRTRLEGLLSSVHLPGSREFLARRPGEISVGQAQRVLIALALLHGPAILIADEPTSALDPANQKEIVKLLQQLNRDTGTTMLYISHDMISVLKLCDRIAVLDSGRIAECVPVLEVEQTVTPATVALVQSLPVPARMLLALRDTYAEEEVPVEALAVGLQGR